MPKLYFNLNTEPEFCYPLSYHMDQARENGLDKLELYLAKPVKNTDMFWCKAADALGLKSDNLCGLQCSHYKPRNGRSGICKHKAHTYAPSEEKTIFDVA